MMDIDNSYEGNGGDGGTEGTVKIVIGLHKINMLLKRLMTINANTIQQDFRWVKEDIVNMRKIKYDLEHREGIAYLTGYINLLYENQQYLLEPHRQHVNRLENELDAKLTNPLIKANIIIHKSTCILLGIS